MDTELTREEKNLLIYFETCCVDQYGKVSRYCMNQEDFQIAKKWNENGFVKFGRIISKDIKNDLTNWCELSEQAWLAAHSARKERAIRMMQSNSGKFEKVGE